jgi:perosamine synthetase
MIPVYQPFVGRNQKKYVNVCLDSNWISSRGDYIEKFEGAVAEFIGTKHAISTFNGSVSLSLILAALGIGRGAEVIVPSLTYAATVSAICWSGAMPVLADSDANFQLQLLDLEKYITPKTKAIMVPQLYGDSPDMAKLIKICNKNNLFLIEDSAECFGGILDGRKIGSFGTASSFSFFANKTITTGEGGIICTNDDVIAKRVRLLKNQSHIGSFMHNGPGFNFRMTNIQAAIGLAQIEHIEEIIIIKKIIAEYYRKNLPKNIFRIEPVIDSAEWMPLFVLPQGIEFDKFNSLMTTEGIDTRPSFCPIHLMQGFKYRMPNKLPVSEKIYKRGFNLPSFPDLTVDELNCVIRSVEKCLNDLGERK